ncbi:MAG: hypothetical protein KC619_16740, partial [Myxococcales bacterium]|nr:hypothetical protein [Myxococcales bacterium]
GGRFVTVDPFEMTVTSAPLPPTAEPIRQRHDAIGLDGPGVIASCSGVMDAAFEGYVELELYTADGQPAGAPVRVSTEPDAEIAWPCAVGSDGERIFVAWQLHERDVVRVRGYRLRR